MKGIVHRLILVMLLLQEVFIALLFIRIERNRREMRPIFLSKYVFVKIANIEIIHDSFFQPENRAVNNVLSSLSFDRQPIC